MPLCSPHYYYFVNAYITFRHNSSFFVDHVTGFVVVPHFTLSFWKFPISPLHRPTHLCRGPPLLGCCVNKSLPLGLCCVCICDADLFVCSVSGSQPSLPVPSRHAENMRLEFSLEMCNHRPGQSMKTKPTAPKGVHHEGKGMAMGYQK